MQTNDNVPRRGWRETVEPGLYRNHRVSCPRSDDHRSGGRCGCPFTMKVPDSRPGRTRTVSHPGPIADARAERRRLMSEGRPDIEVIREAGTLNDFAAHYFRAKASTLAANTIRNREDDYLRRITPELGDLALDRVTRERVEVWMAGVAERSTSQRMLTQTVATLRVILQTAVNWDRIPQNAAARLWVPRIGDHRLAKAEHVITLEQLHAVIAAAGTIRTETMIRAAGEAGLRRGEVTGLQWGDVDFAGRRLHARRQVVQERLSGGGHRKVVTQTKGRRARKVAISEAFAARLADQFAVAVIEGGADAAGWVWPGKNGEPMHDRSAARAFERACLRAGLVDESGKPVLSLHGLRHTAASIMLGAGVPLLIVSRQLGHANPNITATIYAHLMSDSQLYMAATVFDSDRDGAGDGAGIALTQSEPL